MIIAAQQGFTCIKALFPTIISRMQVSLSEQNLKTGLDQTLSQN